MQLYLPVNLFTLIIFEIEPLNIGTLTTFLNIWVEMSGCCVWPSKCTTVYHNVSSLAAGVRPAANIFRSHFVLFSFSSTWFTPFLSLSNAKRFGFHGVFTTKNVLSLNHSVCIYHIFILEILILFCSPFNVNIYFLIYITCCSFVNIIDQI